MPSSTEFLRWFTVSGIVMIIAVVATVVAVAYFDSGKIKGILVTIGITVTVISMLVAMVSFVCGAFSVVEHVVSEARPLTVQIEIVTPVPRDK